MRVFGFTPLLHFMKLTQTIYRLISLKEMEEVNSNISFQGNSFLSAMMVSCCSGKAYQVYSLGELFPDCFLGYCKIVLDFSVSVRNS